MPALQPVDETFFASAPQRFERMWPIARPAAEVWTELCGETPLHWCTGLKIQWTSARPFGVGTTRRAKVLGALAVEEEFFVWEEGRRQAFFVTRCNLPLFNSLAEDYVVEPDGDGACRLTWRVGVAPSAAGKPGGPVNKLLFGRYFAETGKHFGAA